MEKRSKLQKVCNIGGKVVLGAAFLGFIGWSLNKTNNNYAPVSKEDYKNAKWYESSATPNEAYNFENIPHNQITRDFYFQQIKEKNGSLEKAYLYPDLDKNEEIAK